MKEIIKAKTDINEIQYKCRESTKPRCLKNPIKLISPEGLIKRRRTKASIMNIRKVR